MILRIVCYYYLVLFIPLLKLFCCNDNLVSIFTVELLHFVHLVLLWQEDVGGFVIDTHVESRLILPLILINMLPRQWP